MAGQESDGLNEREFMRTRIDDDIAGIVFRAAVMAVVATIAIAGAALAQDGTTPAAETPAVRIDPESGIPYIRSDLAVDRIEAARPLSDEEWAAVEAVRAGRAAADEAVLSAEALRGGAPGVAVKPAAFARDGQLTWWESGSAAVAAAALGTQIHKWIDGDYWWEKDNGGGGAGRPAASSGDAIILNQVTVNAPLQINTRSSDGNAAGTSNQDSAE